MFGRNKEIQELRTAVAVAASEQKHLKDAVAEARSQVNGLWVQLQDLHIKVQLLEPKVQEVPMYANIPMHVTDDEEDAKWQLDNGLIEKKDYEALLEQLGLEPNVEIEHY